MLKVSVVVPTYNQEVHLRRAIESISAQTYRNIEIIIINDGSTDSSLEICNQLANDDSRIILHDVDNAGVSAARNLGIDVATGDMLMFCDSDDITRPAWVERLVSMTREAPGSLGVVGFSRFTTPAFGSMSPQKFSSDQDVATFQDVAILAPGEFYELERRGLLNSNVNKIYDLAVVRDNSLRFVDEIASGEDLLFNLGYLRVMPGSIFLSMEPLYMIRTDTEGSLSKHHGARSWELSVSLRSEIESLLDEFNGTLEPYAQEFYTVYLDLLERALADIPRQYPSEGFIERNRRGNAILASLAATTAIERADLGGRSPAYRLVLRRRRYELLRLYALARRCYVTAVKRLGSS